MHSKFSGCTDQPAVVDQFNIKKYIDGLVLFIRNCNTPMTIAIQGDWGTGKTSVMRMDRLQPGKAVELLEVLKLFLDCEKCVFVLAIDYSVVSRGVKEKYGEDFSDAKGRSFFDKIIQVPFKMPVASYDIEGYVEENLAQIGVTVEDKKQQAVFVSLIESSIGNNPRSMKRLFNSFLLLRGIADDRVTADPHNEEILFALLCMQSQYEAAYNYLMKYRDRAIDQLLDCLREINFCSYAFC